MDQPATQACDKKNATFRGATITHFGEPWTALPDKLDYIAFALETCPTTGRAHYQTWAYSTQAMRLSAWKKIFPGDHIEQMRGNFEQNDAYCSKQSELTTFGTRPMGNGKRRDLSVFCQRVISREPLRDISLSMPTVFVQYHNGLTKLASYAVQPYEHETVRGYWLYGVPGAGKSHYARTRFSDIYIKAQNKWFDGYAGEQSILLDDYDCGKSLGHYLKIWCDKWACTGEIKGGTVHLRHHHFIITSNYSINEMFADDPQMCQAIARRCEVIHFPEVYQASLK